jgi:hypothetical protein
MAGHFSLETLPLRGREHPIYVDIKILPATKETLFHHFPWDFG